MLRDEAKSGDDEGTWGGTGQVAGWGQARDWKEIDRELRGIAKRRAALDADEARWLREAERVEIWKQLGMVSLVDYMERVLGYAPRTAQQRMQVARALATLPVLADALTRGELSFTAVRELVRVATPSTEHAWRAHVSGMNLRQIEDAVAGHRPGDLPTDAPDDDAREHVVTLHLDAAAYATWRQGRTQLDAEHDHRLDDSELVIAMLGGARVDAAGEISGRAKFQIALSLCPRCERGVQEGAGVVVPVDAATVARARCDAQHLGSIDGDAPERAHQDIPPSVVRFVFRRDKGRCQTPGCRSARGIEIHHIEHREHGGSHEPKNLTLRCSACHAAHHRGLLDITGEAPDRIVTTRRAAAMSPPPPPSPDGVITARRAAATSPPPPARIIAARRVAAPSTLPPDDVVTTRRTAAMSPRPPARIIAARRVAAPSTLPPDDVITTRRAAATSSPPPARIIAARRASRTVAPFSAAVGGATERFTQATVLVQARDAMKALGWKPAVVRAVLDEARAHVGASAPLEVLLREALRRCPMPG